MKINFLSSKVYVGSKTKEAKIRNLSISKDRIMTISVDNLKWMGIEDAVLSGLPGQFSDSDKVCAENAGIDYMDVTRFVGKDLDLNL